MLENTFFPHNRKGEIDFLRSSRVMGERRKSVINIVPDTNAVKYMLIVVILLSLYSCGSRPDKAFAVLDSTPKLEPDYTEVTIPPNIAPLNFIIREEGTAYFVRFSSDSGEEIELFSRTGEILLPRKKWHKLLKNSAGKDLNVEIFIKDNNGEWIKYKPFKNRVAIENIDPFLYYRLLYPGYESWSELSINRRNIENFRTSSLIENTVVDENCVNCHAFNTGRSDDFLFHMRGSMGGTYFYSGEAFSKVNLKTEEMKNGAVYPRWHPSGKFVAFSSNKIIQRFHAADNKKVEVSDLESSLVLYDLDNNEMMDVELANKEKFMDTYPEWSPDGRYIYFCRADQIGEEYDYKEIKYNLFRASFDQEKRTFGNAELVFDARQINKSVSFPRISPDGRFLVVTVFDYGCFPIWHKEADLYLVKLESFETDSLDLNSDFTDSYHSWSSNGKWLVFSSRRGDGLSTRPYISYIREDGTSDKPFILPQEDPEYYNRFLKSFNIPEFATIKVKMNPGEIRKLAKTEAIQAKWHGN